MAVNLEEHQDKFAIHAAAREGKTPVVEALLKSNDKLALREDDDGRLPIHWATSANNKDIVLLLAHKRRFDPDVQDASGWTPLMIAASVKEGEEVVDLLLQKGADVTIKNNNGQNVLHFIASKSNLDLAKKLLGQEKPVSARVRDKRGQYAIHRAAAVGSVPMIDLLLRHKSPLNATDSSGYTPLHHAVAEGHGGAAVALLKEGAETDKKDADGYLALDLAPNKEIRKYIQRYAEAEGIEL